MGKAVLLYSTSKKKAITKKEKEKEKVPRFDTSQWPALFLPKAKPNINNQCKTTGEDIAKI